MASKKGLKRHFRESLNNLASKVYFPLLEGSDKQQEQADALLDKAADILDTYSVKVSNSPKDSKEIGKFFSDLRADFNKELANLNQDLSKILSA